MELGLRLGLGLGLGYGLGLSPGGGTCPRAAGGQGWARGGRQHSQLQVLLAAPLLSPCYCLEMSARAGFQRRGLAPKCPGCFAKARRGINNRLR